MLLSAGDRLAAYEILGVLGAGGPASARLCIPRELRRGLAEAQTWRTR